MTTWATISEVEDITGVTVTAAQLSMAGGIIDAYSNRTHGASGGIRTRDLSTLRQAVSWQAVWLVGQYGTETRAGVTRIDQDGELVDYATPASVVLAPLAQRCLKNLSWKSNRSLRVKSEMEAATGLRSIDYTLESSDNLHTWESM